ncbi:MAG: glycosyltransferase [Muribaculaceae bacterium]|nr:glycosyltransferase [Muribaculaceae bacterium]
MSRKKVNKISVVTITRGDGELLCRNVDSVEMQKLPADIVVEHIIVDGNDSPDTPEVRYAADHGCVILRRPPEGIYKAMNDGLHAATGDVLALLHGTDAYADDGVIAAVAEAIDGADFVFGDIRYVSRGKLKRIYSAHGYRAEFLLNGFAPPHPSLFIRRELAQSVGYYRQDMRIAADYEYFVRIFFGSQKAEFCYVPRVITLMDADGISSTLYSRIFTNSIEIRRSLRLNGLDISFWKLMTRYLYHFRKICRK